MDKKAVSKGKSGLTFLELVLAMSVLAIIVTGSGAMSLMAARLGNRGAAHTGLDHQLAYAYGVLKNDLDGAATLTATDLGTTPNYYEWTIRPAGGTGSTDITHVINLGAAGSKTWTRTQGGVTETLVLQGILSQGPFADTLGNLKAVRMDAGKRLLYMNLEALSANNLIKAPAYLKTYFIGQLTVT